MKIAAFAVLAILASAAMAQEAINVAEAMTEEPAGDSQPPAIDLSAVLPSVEEQAQPQAGPSGPAGEPGRDGASGARGHRGLRGPAGVPGRDADPRAVARMVLAELKRAERGEMPAGWAKPYLDALRAEKEAAAAKKRKDGEDMLGGIIGGEIGLLFGLRSTGVIWRQQNGNQQVQAQPPPAQPAPRQPGQTVAQDAGAMLEEYGVPGAEGDDVEQAGAQRDYVYDEVGRIVRRAGKRWRSRPKRQGPPQPLAEPSKTTSQQPKEAAPPFPPAPATKEPEQQPAPAEVRQVREAAPATAPGRSAQRPLKCRIQGRPGQIVVRLFPPDDRLGKVKLAYWLADYGQKPNFTEVRVGDKDAVLDVAPGEDYYVAVARPGAEEDIHNTDEWTNPRRIRVPSPSYQPAEAGKKRKASPVADEVVETKAEGLLEPAKEKPAGPEDAAPADAPAPQELPSPPEFIVSRGEEPVSLSISFPGGAPAAPNIVVQVSRPGHPGEWTLPVFTPAKAAHDLTVMEGPSLYQVRVALGSEEKTLISQWSEPQEVDLT